MIRRRRMVATAFIATAFIAGCDNQQSTVSPTAPSTFAASTADQSGTAPSLSAATRTGTLHMTKECSEYTGQAGSFCTLKSSNLAAIKVDSKVFYDQALGTPAGLLDSNVVLDAGDGNRAFGRCTLDLSTNLGLCTFSDGTGEFTGFSARVDVDCRAGFLACRWDGTYSFTPERDR